MRAVLRCVGAFADRPVRDVASVDYETDRKIQDTIAYEFKDRTILCIARESSLWGPRPARAPR